MDKTTYTLLEQLTTQIGDPISALNINRHAVIVGTVMGRILMLNLHDKIISKLSNASDEHIASISFEEDDVFSIAVGDDFVLRYQDYNSLNCVNIKNYSTELDHSSKCQGSYSILSGPKLFIIILASVPEGSLAVSSIPCDYTIKNTMTKEMKTGKLNMTNYSIPFDFDGNSFFWVEYSSKHKRNICIADFTLDDAPDVWKYSLPKDFGQISQAKLISSQKMFIVRKMNYCEIRNKNKDFSVEASFTNIGEEVISVSFHYQTNYTFPTTIVNANQVVIHENKEEKYMKLNTNANLNLNEHTYKQKDSETNKQEVQKPKKGTHISIVLLDINGNVNVYENSIITTKFNLNDVSNIPQEQKAKQFFSMGYPYYIKAYDEIYAISSDHGCYVISNT